ncbi:MAG: hypothetical protein U0936_10320 [Planctomycetaceae bacterium]
MTLCRRQLPDDVEHTLRQRLHRSYAYVAKKDPQELRHLGQRMELGTHFELSLRVDQEVSISVERNSNSCLYAENVGNRVLYHGTEQRVIAQDGK